MSTQLILVTDERGFTVQLSTTHQTQTGALAHFLEVLAQLHHQHTATKSVEDATLASPADPAPATAIAETSGPKQHPINPFTKSRPAYQGLNNRREEPPF